MDKMDVFKKWLKDCFQTDAFYKVEAVDVIKDVNGQLWDIIRFKKTFLSGWQLALINKSEVYSEFQKFDSHTYKEDSEELLKHYCQKQDNDALLNGIDEKINLLKKVVTVDTDLSIVVNIFDKFASEEIDNQMLVYETYKDDKEKLYNFVLKKIIPAGSGKYQGIEVVYKYNYDSKYDGIAEKINSDEYDGDFIYYILNSQAFKLCQADKAIKVSIIRKMFD